MEAQKLQCPEITLLHAVRRVEDAEVFCVLEYVTQWQKQKKREGGK